MNARTIAIVAGTAVLAAGAGIGVAAQGETTPASSTRTGPPGMTRGGDLMSSLADELGVSETRLREAMDSLRQTGRPQDLAAALADELGVSVDKVQDALESAMPQGGPGGAPPSGGQAAPAPDDQAAPRDGTTRQS